MEEGFSLMGLLENEVQEYFDKEEVDEETSIAFELSKEESGDDSDWGWRKVVSIKVMSSPLE